MTTQAPLAAREYPSSDILATRPNGQKPAGCPPWWPFGVVPNPPTPREIAREIVNQTPEALL